MIILQFDGKEGETFKGFFDKNCYGPEFIKSQKLGGDEILFQAVITGISLATPYIIDFFKNQQKKNKQITIIKKGVSLTFKNEKQLKKFLDEFKLKKR